MKAHGLRPAIAGGIRRQAGQYADGSRLPLLALMRPSFLLVLLYSVAICFERVVEVEYFKPYRLLGFALMFAAIIKGHLRVDGVVRAALLLVAVGAVIAAGHILLVALPTEGLIVITLLWLFNITTYVAICTLIRDQREIVIVLMVHALAMFFASFDILQQSSELMLAEGASVRFAGDFKNPANACLSMLMATLILITFLRSTFLRRNNLGPKVLIFACGVAIALFEMYVSSLTGSRAGALQFLGGMVVYAVIVGWRRMAIAVVLFGVLVFSLTTQWSGWSDQQSSNILVQRAQSKGMENDRYYLWRSGLDAYVDSYGIGVGIGQYRLIHQSYFHTYENIGDGRMADKKLSLHSDYVTTLVEFGSAGFLIYLFMWRRIWNIARRVVSTDVRAIALALVAAVLIIAASHSVMTNFGLWFYLAMVTLWSRFEQKPGKPGPTSS